ncbi:DUF2637 domain-containing protein [Streptomyces fractus]|uniref:DUF2637 domain-containing protein n=1 Tax=Streptomyces fractus TaxID=641806 RepID=UPI003CF6FD63
MKPPRKSPAPSQEPSRTSRTHLPELDAWLRGGCALTVAGVAAYASYVHQRTFALQGGADPISASLWPLSVDGLLLLATAALLRQTRTGTHHAHRLVWLSFLLGIAVSLAANIAAAPTPAWKPVLVAGWPPVALLLSVELLAHLPTNTPGPIRTRETTAKTKRASAQDDPLLTQARQIDARHRELHQRPVPTETLRKELRIGASRARQLNSRLREGGGDTDSAHGTRTRADQHGRDRSG